MLVANVGKGSSDENCKAVVDVVMQVVEAVSKCEQALNEQGKDQNKESATPVNQCEEGVLDYLADEPDPTSSSHEISAKPVTLTSTPGASSSTSPTPDSLQEDISMSEEPDEVQRLKERAHEQVLVSCCWRPLN